MRLTRHVTLHSQGSVFLFVKRLGCNLVHLLALHAQQQVVNLFVVRKVRLAYADERRLSIHQYQKQDWGDKQFTLDTITLQTAVWEKILEIIKTVRVCHHNLPYVSSRGKAWGIIKTIRICHNNLT